MTDEDSGNGVSFLQRVKRLLFGLFQPPLPALVFSENQVVYKCRTCRQGTEPRLCYNCAFSHHLGHNVVFVISRSQCACVELGEGEKNVCVVGLKSEGCVSSPCQCSKKNTWNPEARYRYRCDTCINWELCRGCAVHCHQGHSVSYVRYSSFVCRCGVQGRPACNGAQELCERGTQTTDRQGAQALECPVCLSLMGGTVLLCENGHSVCAECRGQLHNCPLCRGRLTDIRNITLEALARNLVVDCDNCGQIITLPLLEKHLRVCPLSCPFEYDCLWTGQGLDVWQHCKDKHQSRALIGSLHILIHTDYTDTGRRGAYAIEMEGMYFMFYYKFSKRKDIFQTIVKYLQQPKDSQTIWYFIEFIAASSEFKELPIYCDKVRPQHEDVGKNFKSKDCVNLKMEDATRFVKMSTLVYRLTLQRKQLKCKQLK